jgi:hypothetical protein
MGVGFPFKMVLFALSELHGIDPETLGSRFGALQRGGLLGKQPGRGSRLEYGADELHKVVFAFELAQTDLSPTTVLLLVRDFWDKRLREIFLKAERASVRETPDVVLILGGLTAMDGPEEAVPSINDTTMDKLSQSLPLALDGKSGLPSRVVLVNLSERLRRFHTALSNYHLKPEMLAELETKPKSKRVTKPRRRATRSP